MHGPSMLPSFLDFKMRSKWKQPKSRADAWARRNERLKHHPHDIHMVEAGDPSALPSLQTLPELEVGSFVLGLMEIMHLR